jgi:hypothetical protein
MEIRCTNNFELDKYNKIKNKRIYTIEKINGKYITIKDLNNENVYTFEPHQLYNNFIGNYASTIDGVQGCKLEKPFSIWEMDHVMFNLNRLNSAMGRAVRKDLIHFSHTSPEVQYKWQRYKDNVIIKSKPKNTDRRYSNTNFYLVKLIVEDKLYYYRGHTVNTGDWRLNEHKLIATTNPTSKFHKMLALADFNKVSIEVTETRSLSNRTEAEAQEMLLLEQDCIKYGKQMLNVRHRKKDIKEIKASETKQISKEEYEKLTKQKKNTGFHIQSRE